MNNLTISGNSIGPNIAYGLGIVANNGTNDIVTNNTINSPGWTGIAAYDDINTSISYNRISNVYGVHATGIIAFDNNTKNGYPQSQNVSITNNQINGGNAGIAIEGDPALSGPSATPNNFTIAYNVITNEITQGIADWGNTNTANIYGNIVLNTPSANYASLDLGNSSENISIYDNILQDYLYINPNSPPTADIFSNNVALTTQFLQNQPVNGVVNFGANNTVNATLASVLQTEPSPRRADCPPRSARSSDRLSGGAIGIDYLTLPSVGHSAGNG